MPVDVLPEIVGTGVVSAAATWAAMRMEMRWMWSEIRRAHDRLSDHETARAGHDHGRRRADEHP
jgi:hypothetical protein